MTRKRSDDHAPAFRTPSPPAPFRRPDNHPSPFAFPKITNQKETIMSTAATSNPKPERTNNRDPFEALKQKLLSVGGNNVFRQPDPHVDRLITNGEVFPASPKKKARGTRNRCHQNVALSYAKNHTVGSGPPYEIATGYALAGDGIWRSHSWLWDGERVIETTADFQAYFGFVLDPAEALKFVVTEIVQKLPGWEVVSPAAVPRQ
jgi:hypothetical protein